MNLQYQNLISKGVEQPLESLKFHNEAPFVRRLMSNDKGDNIFQMHIAVHEIRNKLPNEIRNYSLPHKHNCNEWNLILSFDYLLFRVVLGDEEYRVEAPATIFIPQGLTHSANVIEGSGFFVVFVDSMNYNKSFGER